MRLHPGFPLGPALLLAVLAISPGHSQASVPKTLSYQGLLLTTGGAPAPDASYSLTFRIYNVASGGAALWTENQATVATRRGVFNVFLGSANPINLAFDVPYYLGVTIGANPEMSPRTPLSSTAYTNIARDLELPLSKFQGSPGTLAVISNTLAGGGGAMSLESNSSSLTTPVLTVISSTATGGYGVHSVAHASGSNPAAGVYSEVVGSGGTGTAGVIGVSPANYGIDGESTSGTGLLGRSVSGAGIVGTTGAGSASNSSAGIRGVNAATGAGGYGLYANHSGSGPALFAYSASGSGLRAYSTGTAILLQGVHGEISSGSAHGGAVAVRGENYNRSIAGTGVEGHHHGSGIGVFGHADGSGGIGVVGQASAAGGTAVMGEGYGGALAGNFFGPVNITGNLTVGGSLSKGFGSFKIDHPLAPAGKYLYHSFVESPDMKNLYDGRVTTGADGEAVVVLPDYFEALNQDFRYQLTPLGQPARAWISERVHGNSFRVRTDRPKVTLSWQVTGVRHDATARAHPVVVEVQKPFAERGTYADPAAFGKPDSLSVDFRVHARMDQGVAVGGQR